jgi:hypothetical protein
MDDSSRQKKLEHIETIKILLRDYIKLSEKMEIISNEIDKLSTYVTNINLDVPENKVE